jgi:hypothetical protein
MNKKNLKLYKLRGFFEQFFVANQKTPILSFSEIVEVFEFWAENLTNNTKGKHFQRIYQILLFKKNV